MISTIIIALAGISATVTWYKHTPQEHKFLYVLMWIIAMVKAISLAIIKH